MDKIRYMQKALKKNILVGLPGQKQEREDLPQ